MSRSAKLGLFLLMGLVIALARLVEVEVARLKPAKDAPAVAALMPPVGPVALAGATAKASPRSEKPLARPRAAEAPKPEPRDDASAEWPRGPFYTVKKGETLGEIASKVLGSSRHWQRLYEANLARIQNPKAVRPGTRLVVPALVAVRDDR